MLCNLFVANSTHHTLTLRTSAPMCDLSFKRACAISGTQKNKIGSVSGEEIEGNNKQLNFRRRVMASMLRHHG